MCGYIICRHLNKKCKQCTVVIRITRSQTVLCCDSLFAMRVYCYVLSIQESMQCGFMQLYNYGVIPV